MKKKYKICVYGGGSVGHVLAAVLGNQAHVSVNILTRNPKSWQKVIYINYKNVGILKGAPCVITDNHYDAVKDADMIFFTMPSFAYPEAWNNIKYHVRKNAILGAFAGNGGFEWITSQHQGVVFGMQRIPYVCRVIEYGRSVFVSGVRNNISIGTRPAQEASSIAVILSQVLQLEVSPLPNYLNVTLAPTNPILHCSRMHSLYLQSPFEKLPKFYEEWDDISSEIYLGCDNEIQNICSLIPLDMSCVLSIKQHYDVKTSHALTATIKNINSLKGIYAPVRCDGHKQYLDMENRFFTEDVLVNMPVYQYLGKICHVRTGTVDYLVEWGNRMSKYNRLKIFYIAADFAKKAGINSLNSLQEFYL